MAVRLVTLLSKPYNFISISFLSSLVTFVKKTFYDVLILLKIMKDESQMERT